MAVKKTEEIAREEATFPAKPKKKRGIFSKLLIFLVIVGLAGAAVYYYKQYKKVKNNPQVIAQEETQFVVSEVGKLMELPAGETPSIVTVKDKDKLKDQSFFQNAENGDKVLIYANDRQAILFRPSIKKIIKVAPLVIQDNGSAGTEAQTSEKQSSNGEAMP